MALVTLTLAQLQAIFATAYASQALLPANTNAGSTLGAMSNAFSLLALNVQNELVYIDGVSRLATSNQNDCDTFVTPFGVTRLGAVASSGTVTGSTPSAVTAQVVIPVGGVVTTSTNLQFTIIADPNNTTGDYSATANNGQGGYVINVGGSSANFLVQCTTPGSLGNVAAGTITQIINGIAPSGQPYPAITGITSVTNASAFTNGLDTETDVQLRTRFATLMSTGTVATDNAISAAILGVQPGLTYSNGDGLNITGGPAAATVSIYVGVLGSGTATPSTLVASCQTAVNAVRSAGVSVTVYAPSLVTVNVSATIHCPSGTNTVALGTALTSAYNSYVNNLGLNPTGGTTECDFFTVASILKAVSGVTKLDSLLLNSATSDVVASFGSMLIAGTSSWSFASP